MPLYTQRHSYIGLDLLKILFHCITLDWIHKSSRYHVKSHHNNNNIVNYGDILSKRSKVIDVAI